MISREEFQILYDQGPDAVYTCLAALVDTIEAQQQLIVALTARVKELEDRLGKDSHNSSKPPSSDGLGKKPKPASLRSKSGRRSGGQPGHRGYTLEFAERPDHTVPHSPAACQHCGTSLDDALIDAIERRQVFELPPTKLVVTEHQVQTRCCATCGHTSSGEFPSDVAHRVQYGPRVQALTVYLMHFQLLPLDRVCMLLRDLFGTSISEGTLQRNTNEAFTALNAVENAIKEAITKAGVTHHDESGVRVNGKLNWLHSASTRWLTHYAIDSRRGKAAMDKIDILPNLRGRAIHDGWRAYGQFECEHGLCNAHHLRELVAVEEQHKQPWAKPMRKLLCSIHRAAASALQLGRKRLTPSKIRGYEVRYETALAKGYAANPEPEHTGRKGRPRQGFARSLLLRLDNNRAAVLAFMYDLTVPFDNNLAERDIRMIKVKQKVSGCFRTTEGAKAFCRIRGYISTMRKQGYDVMTALKQTFSGTPIMPKLTH